MRLLIGEKWLLFWVMKFFSFVPTGFILFVAIVFQKIFLLAAIKITISAVYIDILNLDNIYR
jgi:hypothetical protein